MSDSMDPLALAMDFIAFATLIPILVLAFILPSKDKIMKHEMSIPKGPRMFQLIVGVLAVVFAGLLGIFMLLAILGGIPSAEELTHGNHEAIRTVMLGLNTVALGGLGALHIVDHVRMGKTLKVHGEVAPVEEVVEDPIGSGDPSDLSGRNPQGVVEEKPARKARIKPKPEPETLTIQCPDCGNTLKITVKKRPAKIKCPVCGLEGEV